MFLLTNFATRMITYLTCSKPRYHKSIDITLNVDDSEDTSILIKTTDLNLFSFIKVNLRSCDTEIHLG